MRKRPQLSDAATLIAGWSDGRGLSQHLLLTLAHMDEWGEPPPPAEPIPGCYCATCQTLRVGGGDEPARLAVAIVRHLATFPPEAREAIAQELADGLEHLLPAPAELAYIAARCPGAVRSKRSTRRGRPKRDLRSALDIDAAREVPLLEEVERAGVSLRRLGSSYRGPCPLHGGDGPNFAVRPDRNRFRCFVCGESGDVIAFVMATRGYTFPEAVRYLTGAPAGV